LAKRNNIVLSRNYCDEDYWSGDDYEEDEDLTGCCGDAPYACRYYANYGCSANPLN
jgi:hypothetical protein